MLLPPPIMLPLDLIHNNTGFNCRGMIDSMQCLDLANEIKQHGLDQPIHVRRKIFKNMEFEIISGHRRFIAHRLNKETEIACVVRTDLDDDNAASAANLRENIHRKELSFIQEAKAVNKLVLGGVGNSQLVKMLGRPNAWIEPRRQIMELPDFVQHEAEETGSLKQFHISQLYKFKDNREKLVELVRQIKERAEVGETLVIKDGRTLADMVRNKQPKMAEIREIRDIIFNKITKHLSPDTVFLPHLVLSWVIGDASMMDVLKEVQLEALEEFIIPLPKS